MDFKKLVMHDTDEKYQDMANGTTAVPYTGMVAVSDFNGYLAKRNNYYGRLDNQKQEFNNAIDKINATKQKRVKKENDLEKAISENKKLYFPCSFVSIAMLLIMCFLTFWGFRNGITYWTKNVLLEETNFKNFFAIFELYHNNNGLVADIVSIVIGALVYIGLIILAFKKDIGGLKGWLFGGLILEGAPLAIPMLAARLLCFLVGYLIYFLVTPYGLIALGAATFITLIILGKRLYLKRYKFKLICSIILILMVATGCCYLGRGYSTESYEYCEQHNGSSYECATIADIGKTYTTYLNERDTMYYYVFTPTHDYEVKFTSSDSGEMGTIATLYSSNKSEIKSNKADYSGDFELVYQVHAGETYYLVVGFNDDYDRGHFKVHFTINS